MIVDLERNDLGRIARSGGVRGRGLAAPRELRARAPPRRRTSSPARAAGVGALDVLAALFPGGSVTGAPKLAAMARDRRASRARAAASSPARWASSTLRGRSTFNILIRTLEWRPMISGASGGDSGPVDGGDGGDGEVLFQVGGGITWSSDPTAEDQETLTKARGLIEALASAGDVGPVRED